MHFRKSSEEKSFSEVFKERKELQPVSMDNSFKESFCKKAVAITICGLKEDFCLFCVFEEGGIELLHANGID